MPPEIEKGLPPQETSELIQNPMIIVDKISFLSKHPKDNETQEKFKKWIINEWEMINSIILTAPYKREVVNAGPLNTGSQIVRIKRIEDKDIFLAEDYSRKGIDRIRVELEKMSTTERLSEKHIKKRKIVITFAADSRNRKNLIGVVALDESDYWNTKSHKSFGYKASEFEVEISPFEVRKVNPPTDTRS